MAEGSENYVRKLWLPSMDVENVEAIVASLV